MKYLFLAAAAAIMIALVLGASYQDHKTAKSAVNSDDAEPIKAKIINEDPSNFTIDVGFLTNMGANTEAKYFAVYTSNKKPSDCGDFRDVDLTFEKPEKNHRRFNLSGHGDILSTIERKKCVIIPNSDSER